MRKITTTALTLLALAFSGMAIPGYAQTSSSSEAARPSDADAPGVETPAPAPSDRAPSFREIVTLRSATSPIISIKLMFSAGSMFDPKGKEGLAALTGLMLAQSGTAKQSYAEIIDKLYPMAAAIEVTTDREVTVISGNVHRETLSEYLKLLLEGVLEPGFRDEDFKRHKAQLEAYLSNTLRASNDELLGLEALQQVIFAGHPYGHAPEGTIDGLAAITLDDVKSFYLTHYYPSNLMLGLAGGYPEALVNELSTRLAGLPKGGGSDGRIDRELPTVAAVSGRDFTLVEKPTDSVGIHFGYALGINRSDPDYYPLMVANSFLGEHRTFHGRLMKQLRGKRGLNYGDYSYVEHWHLPPFTSNPTPTVPRRQQYFSVWVRPVVPDTAHFALRNALYEVDRLVEQGMTQEEFELARDFVTNYSKLWAQSPDNRLGFLMDSSFYGMPSYIDEIDRRLKALTLEQVNRAIKKHIQTRNLHAVMVTANADAMKSYLTKDEPSPMAYNAPPEEEVIAADKTIEKIPVRPDSIVIIPIQTMFQSGGE